MESVQLSDVKYKGYTITRYSCRTKTVCERNPISGHEWSVEIPTNNKPYYVIAERYGREFKTPDKAKEYIDFIRRYNV